MRFVATVVCDGRPQYLPETIAALEKHVHPLDDIVVIDDSADIGYAQMLESSYPQLDGFVHHSERRGLGGAVKSAWEVALDRGAEYVWRQEDDCPVTADIDLNELAAVLDSNPHCAQLMLMRPPFNSEEINAGGVYALNPHLFTEQTDGTHRWVEHDSLYGFQPNLTPRSVIEYALEHCTGFLELDVTAALLPAGYRFGYWGGLDDPPMCVHAGVTRSSGYRW